MKKFPLSIVTDTLFSVFITFVLAFVLFNYITPRPYSFIISGCITTLVSIFTLQKLINKRIKKQASEDNLRLKTNVLNQLDFSQKSEITSLFEKAFNKCKIKCERKKGGLYIPEKKYFVYFAFGFDGATKKDVVKAFNCLKKEDTAHIYATEFSPDVIAFAARFNGAIILKDGDFIYDFLNNAETLPKITCTLLDVKPLKKNFIKEIFRKKRARNFALLGLMFLIMSIFVPLKLYYIIFGCSMLIFSVICKLYGADENKDLI